MTDRQTQSFKTPGGNTVVFRSYLTGREAADIKDIMLSSLKMTMSDFENKKIDMGGLSGAVLAQQERKTFDYLVVSVNEETNNPVEKLLDLPSTEYDAVLKEIENIKNPLKPEQSAQPGSATTRTAQ